MQQATSIVLHFRTNPLLDSRAVHNRRQLAGSEHRVGAQQHPHTLLAYIHIHVHTCGALLVNDTSAYSPSPACMHISSCQVCEHSVTLSSRVELKDTAVATAKCSVKQLKDETVKKLKSNASPLLRKLMQTSTSVKNYVDFEPGLGPKHRQPGFGRKGLSPSRLRAEDSRYASTLLEEDSFAVKQLPTWQRCVEVVFELNHQYPQVLTCMSCMMIVFSWLCTMELLMLQSQATDRDCSC